MRIAIVLRSRSRCPSGQSAVMIKLKNREVFTGLGDTATTFLLILLNNADLLEGLEDLAVNGARGVHVVARSDTPVLGGTVPLAQAAT